MSMYSNLISEIDSKMLEEYNNIKRVLSVKDDSGRYFIPAYEEGKIETIGELGMVHKIAIKQLENMAAKYESGVDGRRPEEFSKTLQYILNLGREDVIIEFFKDLYLDHGNMEKIIDADAFESILVLKCRNFEQQDGFGLNQ